MTGPILSADPVSPVTAPPASRRRMLLRVARMVLLVAALAFLVAAVVTRWDRIVVELAKLSPLTVLASMALVLAGLTASMLGWRELLADLGTRLPVRVATRVLFLGQLSKYIPGGSVWSVVAQTELGRDHGVSRRQSAAAAMIHNVVGLGIGLLLAGLALPALLRDGAPDWTRWILVVLPFGLVCFVPPVLTRLTNLLFRLLRREPLERPFTWGGVLRATGCMVVMWLLLAGHVYLFAVDLGADPLDVLVPAVGAYALAWSGGFLAMVLPAGAGTREVLLAIALGSHLPGGAAAALTVALVSRLVMTVGDVIAALLGVALGRGRPQITAEHDTSSRSDT